MSQELLNEAANHLVLGAIYLKGSQTFKEDNFSTSRKGQRIQHQSFRGLLHCDIQSKEKNNKQVFLYKYIFSVGVRLVDSGLEEGDKGFVLVSIEAEFETNYLSDKLLEEECIEAFGKLNVGYHVWPYWREYVQSTCARMGINPIVVPLYTDLQKKQKKGNYPKKSKESSRKASD
ncbi:hypothetical protein Nhal_0041 [Nitrosococcus halophilus Nc 4]|uniref:Preprotein translocase subunit SecB n=1 Tax=Nitrosococcus halophilus (strain Nc4) TaxID=472759 RepID=D5C474_NITHN|nr:hypothetical protein [Nitrosococcus halophilus]ADE13262.1 hypothetical protein Nhal_0041 [Nitrosococcus halophilus Nc 4]